MVHKPGLLYSSMSNSSPTEFEYRHQYMELLLIHSAVHLALRGRAPADTNAATD